MQYLFLDESGELGFSQNSSSYFLLTILQTDAPKQLKNAVRRQKKALHDAGWPPGTGDQGHESSWVPPHQRHPPTNRREKKRIYKRIHSRNCQI